MLKQFPALQRFSEPDRASLMPDAEPPGPAPLVHCDDPGDDEDRARPGAASDEVARELADIERATAALRRGEPALESWTDVPRSPSRKPRPVWLLIGMLWLSTVLVTAGAVVAIATLAG